jgi:hypothetical protein
LSCRPTAAVCRGCCPLPTQSVSRRCCVRFSALLNKTSGCTFLVGGAWTASCSMTCGAWMWSAGRGCNYPARLHRHPLGTTPLCRGMAQAACFACALHWVRAHLGVCALCFLCDADSSTHTWLWARSWCTLVVGTAPRPSTTCGCMTRVRAGATLPPPFPPPTCRWVRGMGEAGWREGEAWGGQRAIFMINNVQLHVVESYVGTTC